MPHILNHRLLYNESLNNNTLNFYFLIFCIPFFLRDLEGCEKGEKIKLYIFYEQAVSQYVRHLPLLTGAMTHNTTKM